MSAKKKEPPFEELYGKLEQTVEKLEQGGLPLEQSIALYEEGMALAKQCQAILDGAEQRITKLRDSFNQAAAAESSDVDNEGDGLLAGDDDDG